MCKLTYCIGTLVLPIPVTLTKAIVDLLLWTVNYKMQRIWVSRTATDLKELPEAKENKANENGDTKMSPLFLYNFQLLSIFTKPLPFIAPAVVTIIKALGSTFFIPDVIL